MPWWIKTQKVDSSPTGTTQWTSSRRFNICYIDKTYCGEHLVANTIFPIEQDLIPQWVLRWDRLWISFAKWRRTGSAWETNMCGSTPLVWPTLGRVHRIDKRASLLRALAVSAWRAWAGKIRRGLVADLTLSIQKDMIDLQWFTWKTGMLELFNYNKNHHKPLPPGDPRGARGANRFSGLRRAVALLGASVPRVGSESRRVRGCMDFNRLILNYIND